MPKAFQFSSLSDFCLCFNLINFLIFISSLLDDDNSAVAHASMRRKIRWCSTIISQCTCSDFIVYNIIEKTSWYKPMQCYLLNFNVMHSCIVVALVIVARFSRECADDMNHKNMQLSLSW
jgi:hypothetical protein